MAEDDQETRLQRITTETLRRDFMKKGALVTGGLALGLSGVNAAQDDTPTEAPTGDQAGGGKALMFNDEFRPGAQFRVKSPIIEQDPEVEGVQEGDIWSEYNTRRIEYLNTNEEVFFFPAHDAEIQQGNVYELHTNFTLFADDVADQGIITVSFDTVPEEDVLVPNDNNQFDPGDDYDVITGGGKALVNVGNFYPNALLRITSEVVDWNPPPDVQGSDIFSEYNTRYAEYLNSNERFPIYPAHDAEIEEDGVYVMRDEFDVTDPEGFLVTTDLDRVDEDDLPDGLL